MCFIGKRSSGFRWRHNRCFLARLLLFSTTAVSAALLCVRVSPGVLPLLRPLPLGERLIFRRPVGTEPLAAGGAGSLQPGHGRVPAPQAKWAIHRLAHRERQSTARPLLYRHAAAHHRVSTGFCTKKLVDLITRHRDVGHIRWHPGPRVASVAVLLVQLQSCVVSLC